MINRFSYKYNNNNNNNNKLIMIKIFYTYHKIYYDLLFVVTTKVID